MRRCCNTMATASRFVASIEQAPREGFGQIKLHEAHHRGGDWPPAMPREPAFPDGRHQIAPGCRRKAPRAVAEMAEADLLWIEEPVWPPEDFAALAVVRKTAAWPPPSVRRRQCRSNFDKMRRPTASTTSASVIKIAA